MALTNKLVAIGNAIRNKTAKIRPLTLDEMVEEINTEWLLPGEQKIKDYVKDFYIRDDGTHDGFDKDDDWKYIDDNIDGSGKRILISYTDDGKILLTARTYKPSGSSKTIRFIEWNLQEVIGNGPAVKITNKTYDYSTPTGETGAIASCILEGIDRNC